MGGVPDDHPEVGLATPRTYGLPVLHRLTRRSAPHGLE